MGSIYHRSVHRCFQPRISQFGEYRQNVYEYLLAGAGIGFGFTLLEEFFYGGEIASLTRLITIALHVVFGIIMARHLGRARHNKLTGNGSVAAEYILAFVVPVVLHTLYDAAIIGNPALADAGSGSDIGLFIALAVIVFAVVWQIVVLVRVKKNAQSYCDMTTR